MTPRTYFSAVSLFYGLQYDVHSFQFSFYYHSQQTQSCHKVCVLHQCMYDLCLCWKWHSSCVLFHPQFSRLPEQLKTHSSSHCSTWPHFDSEFQFFNAHNPQTYEATRVCVWGTGREVNCRVYHLPLRSGFKIKCASQPRCNNYGIW